MRFLAAALLLIFAAPVHAYIDPNVGGQIYQALYPVIALLLGVVAFARQWVVALWRRAMAALRMIAHRKS